MQKRPLEGAAQTSVPTKKLKSATLYKNILDSPFHLQWFNEGISIQISILGQFWIIKIRRELFSFLPKLSMLSLSTGIEKTTRRTMIR